MLLLFAATLAAQSGLQPVPALTDRIIDQTATLSPAETAAIRQKLAALEERFGTQVVVLMVATTAPEDIAPYAHRVADTWKIGRADVGDGLLLVIAKNDRTLRFEVARALEGTIPDLRAARIIDEQITPAFRQGNFAAGILAGLDGVEAALAGDPPPPPASGAERNAGMRAFGDAGVDIPTLIVLAYFALTLGAPLMRQLLGRKLGALASGGAIGAVVYLFSGALLVALIAGIAGMLIAFSMGSQVGIGTGPRGGGGGFGGGGFGGGGFGGGGFGSGGGGSFGGGGASGRW
ncbi:membrane protein [Lampropedia cohaerens]|uniref:Membrane protein n=2 Tax=Lampropedia cohaerens TaxID=1610491 RepID=A0A0U1PWJ1_9BURK|nr:membrane protein [Lampropedia cohaerens]